MMRKLFAVLSLASLSFGVHAIDLSTAEVAGLRLGMTEKEALAAFNAPGFKLEKMDPKSDTDKYSIQIRWQPAASNLSSRTNYVYADFMGTPRKLWQVRRAETTDGPDGKPRYVIDYKEGCERLLAKYGEPSMVYSDAATSKGCGYQWAIVSGQFVPLNRPRDFKYSARSCSGQDMESICTLNYKVNISATGIGMTMGSMDLWGKYKQESDAAKKAAQDKAMLSVPKAKVSF